MEIINRLQNSHTSQFNLWLPKPVEKCCCGIASMLGALKYFGINDLCSDRENTLNYISSGKYTQPIIMIRFRDYEGLIFPVTLESLKEAQAFLKVYSNDAPPESYSLEVVQTSHTLYLPAFLMKSGTDIRGISRWLDSKGLKTEIYEYRQDAPLTELQPNHSIFSEKSKFINTFKRLVADQNALLICSVTQSKFNYTKDVDIVKDVRFTGTHIVIATKADESDKILYADPAWKTPVSGVKQVDLNKFLDALLDKDRREAHFLAVWKK